jgi:signal transduction histidine kinase
MAAYLPSFRQSPLSGDFSPLLNVMQNDDQVFSELFDVQPQAIVWLKPVWSEDGQRIADFEFAYCNEEGLRYLNLTREQMKGLRLSVSPTVSDELREQFMQEIIRVYQTGERSETDIYNPALNKYARVLRAKLRGGVLTVVQDRTEEVRMIQELEEKTAQLEEAKRFSDNILDASLNVIFVAEAVRNPRGHIQDFRITKINKQYVPRFGYSEADLKVSTMLTLYPSMKSNGSFEDMCQVTESGDPLEVERYYEGEGINAWFHYSIVKLSADKVVVTICDVTDQKETVEQVEHQKTLLDNILQHSPAGISVTEVIRDAEGNVVDGRTILANDIAVQYIGLPKEEYLTKTIREIDPTLFDSPLYQMALSTLLTGKPFHTQYFFEPTGQWLELSVAKMDENHLINVFLDVTSTKEAQLRQQKLLEELQRSNVNLEEFAYAASHDLKEPIRKVLFFADRLKNKLKDRLDEEDARLFSRLEAANKRMGGLVDDLLTYSQVSQHPHTLGDVDLNVLMQGILDDLELEIEDKGAKITIDRLATIKGHQRQLQQLFQNLLGNALKYSKPDVPPEIEVRCYTQPGQDTGLSLSPEEMQQSFYVIEMRDNGIGFEQADAERIFNVFQRLHGRTEYSGSGVGLAIARKVAQNHGGYITAESAPGEGATFRVYLPVELRERN